MKLDICLQNKMWAMSESWFKPMELKHINIYFKSIGLQILVHVPPAIYAIHNNNFSKINLRLYTAYCCIMTLKQWICYP